MRSNNPNTANSGKGGGGANDPLLTILSNRVKEM